MIPSVGRIVHYMLSENDAEQINRRRDRIKTDKWPLGAQAHIGNQARAGEVFPMVITKVWGDSAVSSCNGQVLLDGNDCYWATSRGQVDPESVDKQGLWFAPPRTP